MPSKLKVTCIMLARNLVSQGYPFLEAILSVLPYCDELMICEGYSDDETYTILKKLQKIHEDKVFIVRKKWVSNKRIKSHVFSDLLNEIIDESSGDYILKLDPDHVFERDTIEYLLFLASMYRNVKIFYAPYLYFVGNWVIKPELWAPTFFKKDDHIRLLGDSGSVFFTPLGILENIIKNIRHPLNVLKSIHYAYVPKPVHHYYAIFPGNYIRRIEEHKKFYNKHNWTYYDEILKRIKGIKNWDTFWRIIAKELVEKTWEWYGPRKVIKYTGELPTLIKPLWGEWKYRVRFELISSEGSKDGGAT
ncbi:glycosyltransferase family A protein [Thermococcus sp.]|uniref:glycosyltransferase family A protein n=1 Tax=Thermococcus sp. TaxID=35749 RepID=UPI00262EB0DC|nr:glycosyltransferase family A protein [Thermococcus sp.]